MHVCCQVHRRVVALPACLSVPLLSFFRITCVLLQLDSVVFAWLFTSGMERKKWRRRPVENFGQGSQEKKSKIFFSFYARMHLQIYDASCYYAPSHKSITKLFLRNEFDRSCVCTDSCGRIGHQAY